MAKGYQRNNTVLIERKWLTLKEFNPNY